MYSIIRFVFLCLLGATFLNSFAYGNGTLIHVDDNTRHIDLSAHLEYIKAKKLSSNVTPSDVDANVTLWRGALSGADHLDLRAGTYWLRATLINDSAAERKFQLISHDPWINEQALYYIDAEGNIRTLISHDGLNFPYFPRTTDYQNSAIDIPLPSNQIVTLLWKIDSTPIFRFKPTLWEKGQFEQNHYEYTLIFGFFYGALSALLISYIYLWWLTKNKTWLYFSCYLFTAFYLLSANNGDLYQLVFPSIAWAKLTIYTMIYTIHVSSFCLFISRLLSLRKNLPRHGWVLHVFAGTSALLLLIGYFFHQEFAFISALWLSCGLFLFSFLTILSFYTKKSKQNLLLLTASALASITAIANCMALTSPIAISYLDNEMIRGSGVVLTQLLFFLALSQYFFQKNKAA